MIANSMEALNANLRKQINKVDKPFRLENGILRFPNFIDFSTCELLKTHIAQQPHRRGLIGAKKLNLEVRKVDDVEPNQAVSSYVINLFNSIKGVVELYAQTRLKDIDDISFLQYVEGDFYKPHSDNSLDFSDRRLITCILFLDEPGGLNSFNGGEFVLYTSHSHLPNETNNFVVTQNSGSMIAFKSNTIHEVRPILRGRRHSITAWFLIKD